jgi:hypothetical protein
MKPKAIFRGDLNHPQSLSDNFPCREGTNLLALLGPFSFPAEKGSRRPSFSHSIRVKRGVNDFYDRIKSWSLITGYFTKGLIT